MCSFGFRAHPRQQTLTSLYPPGGATCGPAFLHDWIPAGVPLRSFGRAANGRTGQGLPDGGVRRAPASLPVPPEQTRLYQQQLFAVQRRQAGVLLPKAGERLGGGGEIRGQNSFVGQRPDMGEVDRPAPVGVRGFKTEGLSGINRHLLTFVVRFTTNCHLRDGLDRV